MSSLASLKNENFRVMERLRSDNDSRRDKVLVGVGGMELPGLTRGAASEASLDILDSELFIGFFSSELITRITGSTLLTVTASSEWEEEEEALVLEPCGFSPLVDDSAPEWELRCVLDERGIDFSGASGRGLLGDFGVFNE